MLIQVSSRIDIFILIPRAVLIQYVKWVKKALRKRMKLGVRIFKFTISSMTKKRRKDLKPQMSMVINTCRVTKSHAVYNQAFMYFALELFLWMQAKEN